MTISAVNNRVNNVIGKRQKAFYQISFLLTFVLWFYGFYDTTDSFGDIFLDGVVAVIFSIFTYWIVALGLALLMIPVRIVIDLARNIKG